MGGIEIFHDHYVRVQLENVIGPHHELQFGTAGFVIINCCLFQGADLSLTGGGREKVVIDYPIDKALHWRKVIVISACQSTNVFLTAGITG